MIHKIVIVLHMIQENFIDYLLGMPDMNKLGDFLHFI